MLEMDQNPDGQVVLSAMKKLGNELYLAGSLSRTNVESAHETSLVQFNKKKTTTDQWTSGMQCVKIDIGHPVSKGNVRMVVKVNLGRRTSR
jgi:hypothetical protein